MEELQRACTQNRVVELQIGDTPFRVDVRPMTPHEDAQIQSLVASVAPPFIRGKTPEEDRPDYTQADFLRKKAVVEIEARALSLYWCVPLFKESKPGLQTKEQIADFIQQQFNSEILDILYVAVRKSGVVKAELVNFTSASGSTPS